MNLVPIALLFLHVSTTKSNLLNKLRENILFLLAKTNTAVDEINRENKPSGSRYFRPTKDKVDNSLKHNGDPPQIIRRYDDSLSNAHDMLVFNRPSQLSVSNEAIERRTRKDSGYRRYVRDDLNKNWIVSRSIGITSSSAEEREFRTAYKLSWKERKNDALLDPVANQSRGDIVNMVAARPWRVPCGDANQQNRVIGSCTLSYECPPEMRIFKGDIHCGRSLFVCCAVQTLDKDMYEGFDVTMSDTSQFSTSSEDLERGKRGSRENKIRKRQRKRNRTLKARYRRKRFIKKTIRKLAKEVRKELNRAFRNNTLNRRRVINNLKIIIKRMKRKYRDERHIAKFQQDLDLANINLNLGEKLKQIRGLNFNFLTNDTFRDIIINGTADKDGPKMFQAYPELESYYPELAKVLAKTRRIGEGHMNHLLKEHKKQPKKTKDYLEYDIDFGMLA